MIFGQLSPSNISKSGHQKMKNISNKKFWLE
jgi:hypothetical protein